MKKLLLATAIVASLLSCSNNDDGPNIKNPDVAGLAYARSDQNFNDTYNSLRSEIQTTPNITIVAEVNHKANAESVGKDLRSTKLIFFGNPAVGTPLMQANQLAGLDLPQKMLVYEDSGKNVYVAYNSTSYLAARYSGVGGASSIQQLKAALNNFAEDATNDVVVENSSSEITNKAGVITLVSNNDFLNTYVKLRNAISDNSKLKIIAEVDHQAGASSVGMTLNPTRVIIFGNPELGTPLMKSKQTTALDLPQKMLVWQESDGTVNVSYNNPPYLADRHGINGNSETLETIRAALGGLAIDAAN